MYQTSNNVKKDNNIICFRFYQFHFVWVERKWRTRWFRREKQQFLYFRTLDGVKWWGWEDFWIRKNDSLFQKRHKMIILFSLSLYQISQITQGKVLSNLFDYYLSYLQFLLSLVSRIKSKLGLCAFDHFFQNANIYIYICLYYNKLFFSNYKLYNMIIFTREEINKINLLSFVVVYGLGGSFLQVRLWSGGVNVGKWAAGNAWFGPSTLAKW